MPHLISCPSCAGKLRVPDDLASRRVKCPQCGTEFEAGAVPPTIEPAFRDSRPGPFPPPPIEPASRPIDPSAEDDLPPTMMRRDLEPHRAELVLTLGIIGLTLSSLSFPLVGCCGFVALPSLGLSAVVMWMSQSDLRRIKAGTMDPRGQGSTQAAFICSLIGAIIGGLVLLLWVALVLFVILAQP